MNAGRLEDRIVLEPKILTLNAQGQYVTTWGAAFRLWAEAQRLSEQNARFLIRWRDDIKVDTHRITMWGAIWTINNATRGIGRDKDDLTLTSDFSALVEATHLQSTTKEYIDGLAILRPPE